jgi:hypothetical protein
MSMQWVFFPNGGGQEYGFNDPGEETFKGNVEQSVAREIIQNSLDARDDQAKPVKVVFDVVDVPTSDLPDIKTLGATFDLCGAFWEEQNPKASKFFEEAKVLTRAKKITALRCSDYNTVGVSGSDTDRSQGWYNLLRSSGASSKSAGEGGSFGIGKNAPFVASMMRTVLYSTLTKDKEAAFQGVARLVTHERPKMGTAQHVGYLGDKKGASIRDRDLIPASFARKKPGTDVFILGYKAEATFEDDLTRSVLENFWPAIHSGNLEVDVAGTKITKANLAKLLAKYSNDGEFAAHHYYRAVVDKKSMSLAKDLPHLGEVSLELLPGDGLPKKVAMVRKQRVYGSLPAFQQSAHSSRKL